MIDILYETWSDLRDWRTWLQLLAAAVVAIGLPVIGYAARVVALGW